MREIIVTSQAELDAIPIDFDGRIIIKFGAPFNRAVVNRRFRFSVVARGNSSVVARGNSSVEALENSSVVAQENSSVVAWENSSVVAWENSSVVACGNSSVEAWENSSVVAWGNSSVVARGNSSVEAWENSSVVAWGNSSVVARGNTQVVDSSRSHNITANGNARIVHNPKNINEYISYYNIQHSNGKAKLYKAVHKKGCVFVSNNKSDFEYIVGQTATADYLDMDSGIDCGHGIHIAYKEWAVDFGRNWPDLAILEVEADIDSIVVPTKESGKVRTDKVLVLREVPLEECGLTGKILAKKQKKSEA